MDKKCNTLFFNEQKALTVLGKLHTWATTHHSVSDYFPTTAPQAF